MHYRDAMARFAGAVHVLTTDGPAGKRGTTVIAACSVSDNPPTVLVCLNRENPLERRSIVENGMLRAEHAAGRVRAGRRGIFRLHRPDPAGALRDRRMGHHRDRRADA